MMKSFYNCCYFLIVISVFLKWYISSPMIEWMETVAYTEAVKLRLSPVFLR